MSDKRAKLKGRKMEGSFVAIPHCVMDSENYRRLSGNAIKLLLDLCRQYNGRNNGEFIAAWSYMKNKGWKAPLTLHYVIKELEHFGFIIKTRVGGANKYSHYAVTWKQVDSAEDQSYHNRYVKTGHVPNLYQQTKEEFKRPKSKQKPKKNGKEFALPTTGRDKKGKGAGVDFDAKI